MQLYRWLKWFRVLVALVFFLLFSFFFIDFSGLFPLWIYNSATYLQFVPSVLEFSQLLAWSTAGFIFILILTFFFGRIYCSAFCPLGILQDVFISLHKMLKSNQKFRSTRPYRILQYSILLATILIFLAGSSLLINLLDPFSVFGKIMVNLARPIYIGMNNFGAWILNHFDIYTLYHISYHNFSWPIFLFSLVFVLMLVIMTRLRGRLFCNTLCPVGAVLGLVSRFSLFKIKIQESECTNCFHCAINCKAGCIDAKNMKIDFDRCVVCFDCMQSCPNNGISFSRAKKAKTKKPATDFSKRKFLVSTALFSFGLHKFLGAQNEIVPQNESSIPEEKLTAVYPPGAKNLQRFNELCTACHLCVSACPTSVLQPAFMQYGLQGIFQPYLDYHKSFCNFECQLCTDICPSGALLPLPLPQKKLTQLGKVVFEKRNCIVETEGTDCGACSEHCPTKAVDMVPYKGLFLPEINQEICIGCGACEFACPTRPYKAIYIDGQAKQKLAKEPQKDKIESLVEEEDFPF
jgi:polyferredoxin